MRKIILQLIYHNVSREIICCFICYQSTALLLGGKDIFHNNYITVFILSVNLTLYK